MNSSFVSLLHRCLPTLLLSLAFVFLTGASTSLLAHTCTSGAGLIIESALLLDRSFLLQGETLAGKVTYRNAGCTSLKLKRLVITARRPVSTHASGPYDDFAPAKVPAAGYTTFTIKSGQAITLSASRAFTGQDPFGKWVAYSTYQDAAGAWHDSADVPFTLAVPTPVALAMCVNGSEDALPSGAFELPATQALQLQSALDQHKTVRLEPGKNYRTSVGFITLRSGQRLFGLNNDVPKIVVEPGAQGAVLSGLNHQGLEFPTSTAITRRNCFTRLDGPLSMVGARLEENVFRRISACGVDY